MHVTSSDGEPIRGLRREDFRIADDGEDQHIVDFEMVDLDILIPDERTGRIPEEMLPASARRNFLLLFDLSFSDNMSIHKARLAARNFVLNELHPTDLAAVATYSLELGPQLVVTFTPDRAQLARAIDTLSLQLEQRRGPEDPLRFIVAPPDISDIELSSMALTEGAEPRGGSLEAAQKQVNRGRRDFDRRIIAAWSRSLANLARTLNSVQGRKQVLYFSEGFDSRLLMGNQLSSFDSGARADGLRPLQGSDHLVDGDDRFGNTHLQSDLRRMLRQFRRADCVIQAVDIAGLRSTADSLGSLGNSFGRDGLFYLANETGGELFDNANDLELQLGRLLEATTVTYLLTFRPSRIAEDGSYHKLKVKADLPRGARLSSRSGYYAPRPFNELHAIERELLASNAIASGDRKDELDLDILMAAFRAAPDRAYVPVILEIDGRRLLADHGSERLDVDLYTYVTDERGEMRDFFTQQVGIDLQPGVRDAVARTGIKYYGHLDLGPGNYRVRMLVRNADTGRTAVRVVPLRVPHYEETAAVILPPFFPEAPGSWVLVREAVQGGQDSVVYPFILEGQPYVPAARAVLQPERAADLVLVTYNLGSGPFDFDVRVFDSEDMAMAGGELDDIERTVTGIDGLDRFRLRFRPRGLEQGGYTLQVHLTDRGKGVTKSSSIPFDVLE